jgi:hypothetical protein
MNPPFSQEIIDRYAREKQHFLQTPDAFFAAWQRAVRIAGFQWFGDGSAACWHGARTKWDLCPRLDGMLDAFGVLSSGERLFLAALVSFYNARDGGELLGQCGFAGLADLSGLDLERRQVIAELILNYTGW